MVKHWYRKNFIVILMVVTFCVWLFVFTSVGVDDVSVGRDVKSQVAEASIQQPIDSKSVKSIPNARKCPRIEMYPANRPDGSVYGLPVTQPQSVLFHSVPKCGSRTIVWVMWDLFGNHSIPTEPQYIPYLLKPASVAVRFKELNDTLHTAKDMTFFHGHVRYVNIPGNRRPVYISMLREPYSRYVSWYYFMRHGDGDMSPADLQKKLGPRAARPNETLDDCLRLDRQDCKEQIYYQLNINIFCGHDPRCDADPEYALKKAKVNLEKFLVVGLMEEYEDTIKVLEKLMPSMFTGSHKSYTKLLHDSSKMSKTSFKKKPSEINEQYLKEKLKYDIDFFNYAKEKFHKLKKRLRIGVETKC